MYRDRMNRLRLLSLAKATRKTQKLTQKQVAVTMGTTQSAVSDLESGRVDAHLTTWQRYAQALGKHLSFTIVDSYVPTPSDSRAVPAHLRIAELALSPVLTELSMFAQPQDAAGISRETRLPEPLVTRVLASLEEAGWAEVTVRGRTRAFRLRDDAANAIGLSLHRDRIVGVIVDMNGRASGETESVPLSKPTPSCVVDQAAKLVSILFEKSRQTDKKVVGVGVVLAGIVEAGSGKVSYAPDLASVEHPWDDVDLEKLLQERIQANVQQSLRVAVENDVNALALWRSRRPDSTTESIADGLHRVKSTNAVVLMSGGGIGAGITVDGKIVSGSHSTAGELGHLIVDHSSHAPECRARRKHSGCLETVATVQGILRGLGLPSDTGEQRRNGLIEAERRLTAGDAEVREAFLAAGRYLGRVLPLLSVLDPDSIVVYANAYLHDEKFATARAFADGVSEALTKADSAGVLVGDMPTTQWRVLDEQTGAVAAAMAMLHTHFLNSPAAWYPKLETAVERDSQLVLA